MNIEALDPDVVKAVLKKSKKPITTKKNGVVTVSHPQDAKPPMVVFKARKGAYRKGLKVSSTGIMPLKKAADTCTNLYHLIYLLENPIELKNAVAGTGYITCYLSSAKSALPLLRQIQKGITEMYAASIIQEKGA